MTKSKKILVIGDAMLDIYYHGEVNRISPEAPAPVFKKNSEKAVLGGAANVATNIVAAGMNVSLLTIVGNDEEGNRLLSLMEETGIDSSLVLRSNRATTTKTRFLAANNQQVMRMDVENDSPFSDPERKELINRLEKIYDEYSVIVISDYLKGVLTDEVTQRIIQIGNQAEIKVLVDVKSNNPEKYAGAFLLKPNQKELGQLVGKSLTYDEVVPAAKELLSISSSQYVLATCGAKGMVLVSNEEVEVVNSSSRAVYDVTGAGDTVIAYLAVEIAAGKDVNEAMTMANIAAGIKVEKVGTSPVYMHEVEKVVNSSLPHKVFSLEERKRFLEKVNSWKKEGKRIVTTNGCFDILHKGHIYLLESAKKEGDVLIVLLNADESIKRLKGSNRPVNREEDRATVLSALDCVDAVAIFDPQVDLDAETKRYLDTLSPELKGIALESPVAIMMQIKPDVHVKGGDYLQQSVPEAFFASHFVTVPFVDGFSTTKTIERIKQ